MPITDVPHGPSSSPPRTVPTPDPPTLSIKLTFSPSPPNLRHQPQHAIGFARARGLQGWAGPATRDRRMTRFTNYANGQATEGRTRMGALQPRLALMDAAEEKREEP